MNIRLLTFRLLQVYVAVVRAGSVSEAARRLHLTQPTVSQQLKRLAETVGESLLESRLGRLVPTEAGGELYRASREVLGRFDDFEDYLASLRGGERGRCSIALVNTAQYVLPRLLGPYSRAFPEVDVTLHIGNRRQALIRFERQDYDLYVFSHPLAGPCPGWPLPAQPPGGRGAAGPPAGGARPGGDERAAGRTVSPA